MSYLENCYHYKHEHILLEKSFILAAIRLSNNIPDTGRGVDFIKSPLSRKNHELFNSERRALNIVHTDMSLNCSKLNLQIFHLHVTIHPSCTCGHNVEDNEHF